MQVTRSSIETAKGPADWLTGDVYINSAIESAPPDTRIDSGQTPILREVSQ